MIPSNVLRLRMEMKGKGEAAIGITTCVSTLEVVPRFTG